MKPIVFVLTFSLLLGFVMFSHAMDLKWRSPIEITPSSPAKGDLVKFRCKLKSGGGPSANITVVGKIDGSQVWTHTYPAFDTDHLEWVEFTWTALAGDHTVSFVVDPANSTGETNPDNNIRSADFTVSGKSGLLLFKGPIKMIKLKKNVEVTSISITPENFHKGTKVQIACEVKNTGLVTLKDFKINLKMTWGGGSAIQATGNVNLLEAGKTYTMKYHWYAQCYGEIKCTADSSNSILNESDEADNTKTIIAECAEPAQLAVEVL
jgi:subtilase family serine protease